MIEVVRRERGRKRRRLRAPRLSLRPLRVALAVVLLVAVPAAVVGFGALFWCQVNFACQDWLIARWR